MADAEDVPSILLPCAICARTFAPQSLEKHIKVCEKSVIKKRKPFDSAKQRIQGTELEEFLPKQENKRPHQEERIGKSKTSWKQTHAEFLQAIRAARGEPIEVPSKPTPNHVASGAPTRANEKGSCPTCNRQFGIKAYDRHVAWCRERSTRLPLSPATNLAKERLEARIRYRAPALKNRKPTIREKYMPGSVTNLGYAAKSSSPANAVKARESLSLPNCNKGNDSPAKQKPAARKTGQSRDSSIPSGPIKSRPIDRITRPMEDLQSDLERSPISSFSSSSKHPLPPQNPGKLTNYPITSHANYLTKFDTRAITDPISQRKNINLIKTQKLNIVSTRSHGNPTLNDIDVNNDEFGLTIQPCCIHQEHEFVTWKQISKGNFEPKEKLDFKRNLDFKRRFQSKGCLESKDNDVSQLNLLSLKISQDQEKINKIEKSKIADIFNTTILNENELVEKELDLDLRSTWMSRVRKLDQTYLIKEKTDDNLDTEICLSESLKPIMNSPKIIKDIHVSEINSEFFVFESSEHKNISNEEIFVANPDERLLEELPTELDSPTRFNDNISFTSTPISNRLNKEFLEGNSESSEEANFKENLFSNIKTEGSMIENESLSLEDLDIGEWKKNSESSEELLKGDNQKNMKRTEKKIFKNQIESGRLLVFSGAEFEKRDETETKSFEDEKNELKEFNEDKNLLLEGRNELSLGRKEESSLEKTEELSLESGEELSSYKRKELSTMEENKFSVESEKELSSQERNEISAEEGKELSSEPIQNSQPMKEIPALHSSDSTIPNSGKKESSRQRSGTYIIEKPFTRLPKHNRSPDVYSLDSQLEEPLQKRRKTDEDIKNLDYDDRNLECTNLSPKSSTKLKSGEIIESYALKKFDEGNFEENKSVDKFELNLKEENFEVQLSGLKLNEGNEGVENKDELESNGNSEISNENCFDEFKLLNEIDQFLELPSDQIDNDYEVRAEDSLESIVARTKNLKISDEESNSDLRMKNEFKNSENSAEVKRNIKENDCSKSVDPQTRKYKEENEGEKSADDIENNHFKGNKIEESKHESVKLKVESLTKMKANFIKINKEKRDSFIKNNSDESKKLSSENIIKIGTLSRSHIPRQISRTDIKLNTSDHFWKKKKKKEEIPNFKENFSTFKNDLQPKELPEKSGNCCFKVNEEENKFDSQSYLKSKSNFSRRLSRRKETICLSLTENDASYFQEDREEKFRRGRETDEIDIIEFTSKEEKDTFEDINQITIANPEVLFQSKSLSSFTPHDYESVKLNSAKLEKKIRHSLNLLRGSTDSLISSVEDTEATSKTPSMVDFFIDETCAIEEIRTPHGSTRYKLLPVIGKESMTLGKRENVKNNSREDSYWDRASRASMRRLIGSEAVKDEREFRLTKRNPRVRNLPPVACTASGKLRFILPDRPAWNNYVRRHPDFFMVLRGRTGGNKSYDPFLMAEQQMRDLLSDTSDISSTDGISTQPNSKPKENSTHYPLTHSSAFVKYPPQTLPSPIDSSKKRASLIAPPSEFDDLISDFSSDCTETNSISHELFVNDLTSQTRDAIVNSTNNEKSPSRDHIVGRRVIIDKSKALGSDIENSSRGRSSVGSMEKTRKILEKVSCPKIIRPMVNRSHSVRAASAPKIPERKSSSSSESSGSRKNCMKTSKSSDLSLADRSNNNHSNNNNSSSYASTMNGSNLSLNSIVSSDVDIKRSYSMFDELLSSFEEDSSTILPSLRSLLKSDPLSMSSPIQSNKRNGQVSDDDLSSPDSYKRQDHSKLSADSAYSSLNRKYYNHGRSTNDMASRLDEDSPSKFREGDSRFLSKCKMSKFCHECGSKFPESAKFCCECGVKRLTL